MEILLQYCRVREKRFDKFKELMSEFQFDYSEAHMAPEAFGVLTGRTGFLTPEDLAAFDKQADTYLNGQYYSCPSTDLEILERVDNLRHEREHTFYHTLLTTLIDVIEDELKRVTGSGKRRFGGGVLVVEQRPWDKDSAGTVGRMPSPSTRWYERRSRIGSDERQDRPCLTSSRSNSLPVYLTTRWRSSKMRS